MPTLLRLHGRLSEAALLGAVDDLLRRHEVLRRVVLPGPDGEPWAHLRPAPDVPVSVVDLTQEPAALADHCGRAAVRPFRLDRDLPVRVILYRLATDRHALLLVSHHIATDATSGGLLVDDLAALYRARLPGGAAGPPAPRLQRADVAAWERARQLTAEHAKQLDWWREQLAGLPPVLDLPLDRPRGAVLDPRATHVPIELPVGLADTVRRFAADERATVFMVLLAAWQSLLARLAGTTDLAVGTPFVGRRHPDAANIPGCFVDTVVIRGDLSGEPTTRALVDRVRTASLGAFGHSEVAFEDLVDALRPARLPGVTPLVQTLFNSYPEPSAPDLPGLRTELVDQPTGVTKFDLTLTLSDGGPARPIRGGLDCRDQVFTPETAERLADAYRRLLAGMMATPDLPVSRLDLGEPSSLTGPVRDFRLDRPLHDLIGEAIATHPTATAVVASDGTLTYAELDRRAAALTARLRAAGVGRGEPVAVLAERDRHLPVAMLAILRAGGAYVPIDPANPARRTAAMLRQIGARQLICRAAEAPAWSTVDGIRPVPVDDPDVTAGSEAVAVGPDDLAYVVFTSGSTGRPKGVGVRHASICHYLAAVLERIGPAGRSYALVSTPAADLGLTCLFGALVTGATLHLLDRETSVDPERFGAHLRAHPVDVVKMVPSQLQLLARHGELADVLPRRLLILAGEPTPRALVDRIREIRPDLAVQSHYGPTEATVAVLAADLDEAAPAGAGLGAPLGRPMANAVLHVVDAGLRPVPIGTPGELLIGGPGVAAGYLAEPELTAQRFITDPVTGAGRCYRTGDRVRLTSAGDLEYLGRLDDQVKIRGYRVEPGEVAAACGAVPGVAEAVVLPVGEGPDRRLAAWLVPAPGAELSTPEVRVELRSTLPDQLVPSLITILERLPLNPNGKVDRAALPLPTEQPAGPGAAPTTPTQLRIADAWRAVLGVERVALDDDFFAVGGDSFTAVRLAAAVGVPVRVVDVMAHPTVRELAAYLDTHAEGDSRLLQPLRTPAGVPRATLVCVPYGGGSAAAYQPLAAALPDDLALYAAELPGHDPARPDEAFLSLPELVSRCAEEVRERIDGPVVVYGHCVGTAAACALAQRLESDGVPVMAVVLGASFPAARMPGRLSALLNRVLPSDRWQSDRETKDLLRGIGGLPDDLEPAAVSTMMRALRHDAREAEGWFTAVLAAPPETKLRAPVLSVVGSRDRATEFADERHLEWGWVAERVDLATIPNAGHYFLKHQADQLAAHVTGALQAEPAPTADVTPPIAPRRRLRTFRMMALGQLASMIGTQLSAFGLGVWVFQQTGRVGDYALITMLALVPAVFAAPIGGAVADRYDRRRVMLVCDSLAAAAMAALALQYALGGLRVWHVAVAVTVTSLLSAAQRPAYLAAIAQLVPKPYLPQANALAQLGTGVGALLAPFLGGALIVVVGLVGILLVDLVTFLIGLFTLLAVSLPALAFHRREETFRSALAGGWRFILARRPMLVMAAYFVPVNFLSAMTLALIAPLLLSIGSTVELGAVTAAGGLGAAAGAVLMMVWGGTDRRAVGMVAALLPVGAGTICLAVAGSPWLAGAGFFVWWAATSVLNAHWLAILQTKVGGELLGRVLAVNQMLATAAMPAGFLLAPVLLDAAAEPVLRAAPGLADLLPANGGPALLLAGVGVALVVWAVLGLAYRPLRRMEDTLPDAQIGPLIPDTLDELQAEADTQLRAAAR